MRTRPHKCQHIPHKKIILFDEKTFVQKVLFSRTPKLMKNIGGCDNMTNYRSRAPHREIITLLYRAEIGLGQS